MRRILGFWLTLLMLLCTLPALAEGEAEAAVMAAAEEKLTDWRSENKGWTLRILEDTIVSRIEPDGNWFRVVLSVPTLLPEDEVPSSKEAPLAYFKAYAGAYANGGARKEVPMYASVKEENGAWDVTWSTDTSPKKALSTIKSAANRAKSKFTDKTMLKVINNGVLPAPVDMPNKEPEDIPAIEPMEAYGVEMAQGLDLTPQRAALRTPALMMMMEATKLTVTQGADQAILTVRMKDWRPMVADAEVAAQKALAQLVGAPNMSMERVEEVYLGELNKIAAGYVYQKKGQQTLKVEVNLAAMGAGHLGDCPAFAGLFAEYSAGVVAAVERLMVYAKDLPFYPTIPVPDPGILTGASLEGGAPVGFDMGEDTLNHAFVRVEQNGQVVLTGFVHQGDKLHVKLLPGTYQVYFAKGPQWYGEEYLFADDAQAGCFDLMVEADRFTLVHLSEGDGSLPIQPVPLEEVRQIR